MWLLTPIGFFSVVRKPDDVATDTLTVRARVRADLDALREALLPELGPTLENPAPHYPFQARAPRAAVSAAMAQLAEQLDYDRFRAEVLRRQGQARASLYQDVASLLQRMQGSAEHERRPASTDDDLHRATAFGGVLVDEHGRVLLREPANHHAGYVWTFAKGTPEPGETPLETALREVREESGYRARVVARVPGVFGGDTTMTAFWLMHPEGEPEQPCWETACVRWVGFDEAPELIALTRNPRGRARDLAVLATVRGMLARGALG